MIDCIDKTTVKLKQDSKLNINRRQFVHSRTSCNAIQTKETQTQNNQTICWNKNGIAIMAYAVDSISIEMAAKKHNPARMLTVNYDAVIVLK